MVSKNYVTTNEYVPQLVVVDPNGRISRNPDLEYEALLASERNFSALMRRHAYERLADSGLSRSNKDFDTGAAGRLTSIVTSGDRGNDAKILRGYIRRSVNNTADPTGGYRLYFMFNPEMIQRQYVNYLEQQALDPFNTIYGSDNLVAPPGILDFSFKLFFDRQTENANGSMPRGVLEDFDYFDMVVRGVVPDGRSGTQLQDNGIMMINPRNITTVFSPQLSVQGRPYRASVEYQKFDHNMTPIRMVITLMLKVTYIGPVRADFNFSGTKDEGVFAATIPYDESVSYSYTVEELKDAKQMEFSNLDAYLGSDAGSALNKIGLASDGTNAGIRTTALAVAKAVPESVNYTSARPPSPGGGMDCSGLVCWSYAQIGALNALGDSISGYTGSLLAAARRMGTLIYSGYLPDNVIAGLQPGDLVLSDKSYGKSDHVAFIEHVDFGGVNTVESTPSFGGPKSQRWNGYNYFHTYNYVIRPGIAGNDTVRNVV